MKKARGALSLLAVAAVLVLAPSARADSQARIVRLSLVSGPVQIDRGQGFEKAIMNMPVAQGMKLWAQGDSRAEVEFEDGATMRLTPGAKVDFDQLTLLSSGAKASTVKVNAGTVYFNFPHKNQDHFTVAFDDQQLELTHGVRFRLGLTPDTAEIAVFKGELDLPGPKEIKVKKNETATLNAGEKGSYEVAKNIAAGEYDQWDAYRLQYDNLYASAGSKEVPYYYGRNDLNYYGSWGYVPGYGTLWRPYGFGYAWDPFDTGAWAWYPGWGYTWVSSYPWGWIPFRYGSWIWAPNYGWCWRPGGYNAWYTVPAIVSPPPNFVPPQPPPANTVAGTGGGSSPHPPTVIVRGPRREDNAVFSPDGERLRPGLTNSGARVATAPIAAPTTATPATSTAATAPVTTQPSRPVRTFVPSSGPGIGRRPMPLDDSGIAVRGFHGMRDGGRPTGAFGPPPPRTSGSHGATRIGPPPSAPRSTAPSAPRSSAPASVPHSSSGTSKRN